MTESVKQLSLLFMEAQEAFTLTSASDTAGTNPDPSTPPPWNPPNPNPVPDSFAFFKQAIETEPWHASRWELGNEENPDRILNASLVNQGLFSGHIAEVEIADSSAVHCTIMFNKDDDVVVSLARGHQIICSPVRRIWVGSPQDILDQRPGVGNGVCASKLLNIHVLTKVFLRMPWWHTLL
ncbi:MAG: hypothetical protein Q9217_001151 [Psora testacea]